MKRALLLALALALPWVAPAACKVCGPTSGEPVATLKAHTCLSLCLGTLRTTPPAAVRYDGLMLGLTHASLPEWDVMRALADERCDINGASVQLLAQANVGTLRGLALTGLIADLQTLRGVQIAGFGALSKDLAGVQIAPANFVFGPARGLQIGLVNVANKLQGLQIGLLNTNASGWTLPLLNFSW